MKHPKRIKVGTRITEADNKRLETLCLLGGFKSTYALIKYLIFCFLRAADKNDPVDTPLPVEIIELFPLPCDSNDAKEIQAAINNIRLRKKWAADKRRQRSPKVDVIHDEIRDMFENEMEDGYLKDFGPNIKKRI
jgi:hypothetical protein